MIDLDYLGRCFNDADLPSDSRTLGLFRDFSVLLENWNQEVNLISRRDPYSVMTRHFLDSAGLVAVLNIRPGQRIMDLGSGGGFPSLPMAILRPDCQFCSVESRSRKTRFQQAVVDELALSNVKVLTQRAEEVPASEGPFDWVVSRAVADLDQLAKWCRHLIKRPGGQLAVIKGPDLEEEVKRLARKADSWGISGWDIQPYEPFEAIREKESRLVVVAW